MASLRNIGFLVVDDSANVQQIVRAVLVGLEGRQVMSAYSPHEASAMMQSVKPDIVILDLQFGKSSGLELLREIRASQDQGVCFTPVIVLSAHSEAASVQAARDAGANEFCNKPVVPANLLQRVVAVIEKPRAYVRGGGFFGPDRRRKVDAAYDGPERRVRSEDAHVI